MLANPASWLGQASIGAEAAKLAHAQINDYLSQFGIQHLTHCWFKTYRPHAGSGYEPALRVVCQVKQKVSG